ncbi:DUF2892 domain-containing protein [Alicyclobacillus cycloheptanicus]|nr:DUF2892 domain-containing protein [Alicyclobacillus cycloheptanicus]WDM01529.1 DUF2892 domain-containing protein [Alicyclobacillus cycloheptanicus]
MTTGLLALAGSAQIRRAPVARALMMSFGAMKVAEAVTGWCPIAQLTESVLAPKGSDAQPRANDAQEKEDPKDTHAKCDAKELGTHTHDGRVHRPTQKTVEREAFEQQASEQQAPEQPVQ